MSQVQSCMRYFEHVLDKYISKLPPVTKDQCDSIIEVKKDLPRYKPVKFSREVVRSMKRDKKAGMTVDQLAVKHKVSDTTIIRFLKQRT